MKKETTSNALDATDRAILRHVQQDGALSTPQLAERLALSVTPCWRRLKRLQDDGFIVGYQARLDRRRLGLDVLAYVSLSFASIGNPQPNAFEALVRDHGLVLACHKITGNADYMLVVVAANLDHYSQFVEWLRAIPGIHTIHSNLALKEVKADGRLPLPDAR